MAVTVDELLIKIELSNNKTANELGKITKELGKLQKTSASTEKGIGDLSSSILKGGVLIGTAIEGVKKLIDVVSVSATAYFEAEDAVTRLNHALELSGTKNIAAVSRQFGELGDKIEGFGVASKEQILTLARIGTAAGHSAEQTQKLIDVAADLSVARDVPLEAAFKSLSNTLKGSAGQLASFVPELKDLSDEQLKAGDAVKYLSLLLEGYAEKNLETYAGKLALAGERLGDLGEETARTVAQAFGFDKMLVGLTKKMEEFTDWIVKNREGFVSLTEKIKEFVTQGLVYLMGVVSNVFGLLQQSIGLVAKGFGKVQVFFDKMAGRSDAIGQSMIRFGQETFEAGTINRETWQNILRDSAKVETPINAAADAAAKVGDKTKKAREELEKLQAGMRTNEQRQAFDELKRKITELQKAEAESGKQGADLIRAKAVAARSEIVALAEKIRGTKTLTKAEQEALGTAIKLINAAEDADLAKFHADTLNAIQQKNSEIETATKSMYATQREQIQYELDAKLKAIELERQKIDLMDEASQKALDAQRDLVKAQAKEKTKNTLPSGVETFSKLSAGPSAGSALGIAGAIIQAVDAIADMIPGMVKKLGDVFNKVTDLPDVLFKAFDGLFKGITRFISEFVPKLIASIPKSLMQTSDFLNGIVDAFKGLLDSLPGIMTDLINELPDTITKLIESITAAMPEIAIAFQEFLIHKAPGIAVRLAEAFVSKVIPGFINGLISGISRIGKAFEGLLTGKGLKIDPKPIQEALGKLSGESARLFNVTDLLDAAKNPLDAVKEDILGAFDRGRNWLKEAWQWVWDKILSPIWGLVTRAWQWVYDTVLAPIWGLVTTAWQWVQDKIFAPLGSTVAAAWQFVKDMFDGLADTVGKAWQFVKDLWDNLANIVRSAFESPAALFAALKETVQISFKFVADIFDNLKANVSGAFGFLSTMFSDIGQTFSGVINSLKSTFIDPMLRVGEAIAKPLTSIYENFKSLGATISEPIKSAFDGIKGFFDGVGKAFQSLFRMDFGGFVDEMRNAVSSALNPVFRGMKNIVNKIIDFLNNLKIDPINVGFTVLGKNVGFTIPGIDFLPGEIQKLATGGSVGSPAHPLSGFGTDTALTALTPGEFVVSRKGVQAAGLSALEAINNGISPGSTSTVNHINFEINIDAKMAMDEGFIRGTLIPRMQTELKRASLDGKFVISSRGVR